jgi:hypothetical protein
MSASFHLFTHSFPWMSVSFHLFTHSFPWMSVSFQLIRAYSCAITRLGFIQNIPD